jgi:uncharacterized membrane protein YfcA
LTHLWLFAFGIGVGTLSGLLGIGGGIALVPGLILLFGFTQIEAQGTSLAVLSLPVVVFAALIYYRHGHVDLPKVGWLALGFVLGAIVGALLVPQMPQHLLRTLFGAILLYVGFTFVSTAAESRAAALPAGLATLATLILGRWLKGLLAVGAHPPPGEDVEYHI